jgi:hypothetical protein
MTGLGNVLSALRVPEWRSVHGGQFLGTGSSLVSPWGHRLGNVTRTHDPISGYRSRRMLDSRGQILQLSHPPASAARISEALGDGDC